MAEMKVRPAAPSDAEDIVAMVRELAAFEREPLSNVEASPAQILRDCFGDNPRAEVLIGELDGATAGFVLFFHNYSTWLARAGIFIEDLYVRERARGTGLGHALLVAVASLAIARGCRRIDLSVLNWNPARKFYERLGFREQSDWRPYRLEGDALAHLADGRRDSN
jgi:GNAT superfamily N-acetyltransferase